MPNNRGSGNRVLRNERTPPPVQNTSDNEEDGIDNITPSTLKLADDLVNHAKKRQLSNDDEVAPRIMRRRRASEDALVELTLLSRDVRDIRKQLEETVTRTDLQDAVEKMDRKLEELKKISFRNGKVPLGNYQQENFRTGDPHYMYSANYENNAEPGQYRHVQHRPPH